MRKSQLFRETCFGVVCIGARMGLAAARADVEVALYAYVAAISQEPDSSLDLVIVDGRARVDCAREAMSKVRPGGLLLLDDTERSRYELAVDRLAGWERRVFGGLKPGSPLPAQTSIWRKPSAC